MIKIVLNEKNIFITHKYSTDIVSNPFDTAIVSFKPDVEKILDLIDLLQLSEFDYLIIEDDEEACLNKFKEAFTTIVAAGGLVKHQNGDFLFIYRHKKWDLPKGKLEHEEDIALCAIREVTEETGLRNMNILQKIMNTYHLYIEDKMYLKEIHWYLMITEDRDLRPQEEEGISKAIWVNPKNIKLQMNKTYESVLDLFEAMGYWKK